MFRRNERPIFELRRFREEESGVATVDWVLMCCGATAAGLMALEMGQQSLGDYSSGVRDEMQSPYFQTSWTQTLEIPPEEYWDEQDPITPDYEVAGDGSGDTSGEGPLSEILNGNGNNGHGNDADGCDASNPGTSPNCVGDTSDDDGAPPGQDTGDTTTTPTGGGTTTTTTGGGTSTGGAGNTVVTTETAITIENYGFETTSHNDGSWSSGVPGWSVSAPGAADVGDFNPGSWSIDESTVTGDNVAFLYHEGGSDSASMWQTFSEFYSADDSYQFSVDVGDGDYSFSGDQPYELNIYAGSTLIGTQTGTTGDIDGLQTVTVSSTVSDPSLNGQPITFQIVNPVGNGGDLLVDNVQGAVLSQTIIASTQMVSAPVQGCPDPGYIVEPVETTGTQLADDRLDIDVDGGGDTHLSSCQGIPGTGYYTASPSITLDLADMDIDTDFRDLQIRLDSNCDTTLLVRDAEGNWHFDDDSGPGLDSRLRLSDLSALNGQVSIWVGTYNAQQCSDVEVRIKVRD